MQYQIIAIPAEGGTRDYVIAEYDDGSFESFPADPANPNYADYLAWQNTSKTTS